MERKGLITRGNTMMKKAIAFSLVMVMALAGMVALGANEVSAATICSSDITAIKNSDNTITVVISTAGDMSEFDFGIVYDNTKLSPQRINWNDGFRKFYGEVNGLYTQADLGTYVVVGGVTDRTCSYWGDLVKVTFNVIGDTPGSVMLVHDSASYDFDFSNAIKVPTTKVLNLNNL